MEPIAAEFVQFSLRQVPWLLWPIMVVLFFWGLILISKQIYTLCHGVRKNYITELKEHLSFKQVVINEISDRNAQLETQCFELKMENIRREEIINKTIDTTIAIVNEKDMALQRIRNDTEMIIRQQKFALGTALWIIERESSLRKIFLTLLTNSLVPNDINNFLTKNIDPIISIMKSDDHIVYQEIDTSATDFLVSRANVLSTHYLELPITEELSILNGLKKEVMTLPSVIDSQNASGENKT